MKTEQKIIISFIENSEEKTIRGLSKRIKADYKITHLAVKSLSEKGILHTKTMGKSIICSLNKSYYGLEIYSAEEERRNRILRISDLKQLYKEIFSKIGTSFFILLLFGSYAKGKHTKHSDIDLMCISNEKMIEEKLSNILSLLPLKTHLLVFSEEEFLRMKDTKKPNVVQEAIQNNIILYGIESYCRMKNA